MKSDFEPNPENFLLNFIKFLRIFESLNANVITFLILRKPFNYILIKNLLLIYYFSFFESLEISIFHQNLNLEGSLIF